MGEARNYVSETVTGYLARCGLNRDRIEEDEGAWVYPIDLLQRSVEGVDYYEKMLPLVVPGLAITKVKGRKLWFTWSREAMQARLQEVFRLYGVTDERLVYRDTREILSLEIQASPLPPETKENLLYNLGNMARPLTVWDHLAE